jgi:hypothetical protein
MGYVKVFAPTNAFAAQAVQDLLAAAGIPCIAGWYGVGRMHNGIFSSTPGSPGEISVNAEDAERALQVLAGFIEVPERPSGLPAEDPSAYL